MAHVVPLILFVIAQFMPLALLGVVSLWACITQESIASAENVAAVIPFFMLLSQLFQRLGIMMNTICAFILI